MILNVILIALLATGIRASLQCRNEDGDPVDWFVLYKLPKIKDSEYSLVQDGVSYMYMTSEDNNGWIFSALEIGVESSIIGKTISAMYDDSDAESLWLVYNDQGTAPESSSFSSFYTTEYGHTKGIVGGDRRGGFWLVHSVPHFPGLKSYTYPKTGRLYGQSAICVSMNAKNLDLVGELLQLDHPDFFESSISDSLKSLYPSLVKASKGKAPSATNKATVLRSKAGVKFQAFGKSAKFGKDLYQWVAKTLKTDLYVECWVNQANLLSSTCNSSYKVINIQSISIDAVDVNFTTHHDHSKWAVSSSSSKPWICVGDINRAVSQEKRGGGTICTSSQALWNAYKALVTSANEC